jgi:hypothetical protein
MAPHRRLRLLPFIALLPLLSTPALAASSVWPTQGLPVCQASGAQSGVRAVSDGLNGAVVAWVDYRSSTTDIYAQRVGRYGTVLWAANGVTVCDTVGPQTTPEIAPDDSGGVFVAWQDQRKGAGDWDIYIQHVSWKGVLLWKPRSGVPVCTAPLTQASPKVLPDGAGGAIVVWEDQRDTLDTDLYAQRVSVKGVPQWAANGVAVCDTSGDQTFASCAADGAGGVLVAWEDTRASTIVSDIYAQRVDSSGTAQWTANGVVASIASGLRQAYSPQVVADGAGGMLIAWQDYRNVDADVFGNHLDGNGTRSGWETTGKAIHVGSGDQQSPIAVSDGAGGMIVAWEDWSPGPTDLYAQRMSGAGVQQWVAAGVPVCTASGGQTGLCAAPDGVGGGLFAWYDYRSGTGTDIYAQRITAGGAVASGWSAQGLPVCTSAQDQQSPAIVARSDGGPLVAWQDYRDGASTDYDLYARALDGNGAGGTGVGDAAPIVAFAVGEPRPNPAHGVSGLELALPATRRVTARVYDLAGRTVRVLEAGRTLEAGRHRVEWDGRDDAGSAVGPGIYFVRVEAGREAQVRRLVRLR